MQSERISELKKAVEAARLASHRKANTERQIRCLRIVALNFLNAGSLEVAEVLIRMTTLLNNTRFRNVDYHHLVPNFHRRLLAKDKTRFRNVD